MLITTLGFIYYATAVSSFAVEIQEAAISKPVAGLRIGLPTARIDGKWGANETICYECYELLSSPTNQEHIAYVPVDPEYLCQIDLVDSSGSAVEKTDLGKRVGCQFERVAPIPRRPRYDRPLFVFLSSSTNEVKTRQIRTFNGGGASAPAFYRPIDLFRIQQPGEYKLKIRFQLLTSTANNAIELVRFPPLELKVIQP